MKIMRIIVPLLCLTVCALFAVSVGQASHTLTQESSRVSQTQPQGVTLKNVESVKLTKATSLRNVQKVRTELLEGIDTILSAGSKFSGGETTFVNTKVYKDVVDRTIYKTTNSSVLMRAIPEADLKELRALIDTRFEESIRARKVSTLGEGQVNKSLFTGKLAAPAGAYR
ncbi:MAG: hypothetical protein QOG71_3608 [Pyrinomonadaceae bacterium]|nr:hypothetical protein [Pyrinomonadaceae bacterium]